MSKLRAAHWRGPYSVQLTTHQLIFSSVEPNQLYRPLTQCKRLPICDYHTSWPWDMHREATRGPKDLTCCSGCTTWTEGSGHASRRHMLLAVDPAARRDAQHRSLLAQLAAAPLVHYDGATAAALSHGHQQAGVALVGGGDERWLQPLPNFFFISSY